MLSLGFCINNDVLGSIQNPRNDNSFKHPKLF